MQENEAVDVGNSGWGAMAHVNEDLAISVNKQFLLDQVEQGKDFILSSNPFKAKEFFDTTARGKSFLEEVTLLDSKGYKFESYGDFWKALRK